ncbi:FliM/FliN family flagellar motor switch protein [Oceanibacterium hippocampi]|uniref:Flagellar motor switch protein FliN n=1 Tax=Oceanibacterium hippocampi TaxID=745714 RepID=A0A1Y5SGY7_9PROT|nr:FliM/FliN family flagellar motor switch protein [Oceanibacterium hippocampi]SLN40598.1 Flagellar motor switch protein FliN [Oceanibacterium hippocampi]
MNSKAIHDVEVEISVVLGKATMPIHQLLKMGRGAVIELDTFVEDPAMVLANNRIIAKGEIVIVDDHVAVSILETVDVNNGPEG